MYLLKRRSVQLIAVISVCFVLLLLIRHNHSTSTSSSTSSSVHFIDHLISNITHNIKYLDFEYKIAPKCTNNKFLWLITSYAGNPGKRDALRKAYPTKELKLLKVQRIFLLGQLASNRTNHVEIESSIYGDILQANFQEAYKNLTYKHLMGLNWAWKNCQAEVSVIKMDDDIVLNLYDLIRKIDETPKNDYFIMGYALRNMTPKREPTNKWYITRLDYPKNVFPDFVSGWLYITNVKTAGKLVKQSQQYEYFFWIDDVFVTGILRDDLAIEIIDIHQYYATDYRFLECCIKGMIRNLKCEYLAGPDGAQNQLLAHFQKYAQFCAENACGRGDVAEKCVVTFDERIFLRGPGKASIQILQT